VSTFCLPDEELERKETRAFVRRCIARLPESYRVVLALRDIDELSTDEAAEFLRITPNAAKVRLHRARQALGTLIRDEITRQGRPSHAPCMQRLAS
jgi:RNA polymerase sigma-70 factor (ECF subfamily)